MSLKTPNVPEDMAKQSAVIVLLDESINALVVTQRSTSLRNHPGEICFPGGHWQVGDIDLWATALRELDEELGINALRVRLLAQLQLEQTHNGTIIQPWLAAVPSLQPYHVNEHEVAAVFTLPIHDVNLSTNYKNIVVERHGQRVESCQFTASDYFVWGATARIMKQLCGSLLLGGFEATGCTFKY